MKVNNVGHFPYQDAHCKSISHVYLCANYFAKLSTNSFHDMNAIGIFLLFSILVPDPLVLQDLMISLYSLVISDPDPFKSHDTYLYIVNYTVISAEYQLISAKYI